MRIVWKNAPHALVLAAALLVGCKLPDSSGPEPPDAETIAKLTVTAQPGTPTQSIAAGTTPLGLASPRDGAVYVPSTVTPGSPAPLLVLLHGAGGSHEQWLTPGIQQIAEEQALVVLAIDSRYDTWDAIALGRYDPDVAFLNNALLFVFDRVRIDPTRIAIGGFSDGASEALGIGIANAGLFRRIVAFSPGVLFAPFSRGEPGVFLAHGTRDTVVPFANSRDRVVPILRANGMPVTFYPFDGDHVLLPEVIGASFIWLFQSGDA